MKTFFQKLGLQLIWPVRNRNVQVTLQIAKALIEKLPRELPLYARHILGILSIVLGSRDLTLVEDTLPTFATFCKHHDVATLAADQEHIMQYEDIVRSYATFAARNTDFQEDSTLGTPVAIRWRGAGLRALQNATSSEAIGADGGRQLNIVMPTILENLHPEIDNYLLLLHQRANESTDSESRRRRMSIATVRTSETNPRLSSAPISETADDADRLAEEEVALEAMKCLKQVFLANNRLQIRLATSSVLRFVCFRIPHRNQDTVKHSRSGNKANWASSLMETIARWTPVQDRFVILVTAVETLIRIPSGEDNLEEQLVLVSLISWLLKSDMNMIGLSVMDVLLGLVQHMLLLLQLGGKGSNVLPHPQQTDAIDLFREFGDPRSPVLSTLAEDKITVDSYTASPSTNRQKLLTQLQRCIGDLATHIYYSDQISDIIAAILLRLKPHAESVNSESAAKDDPAAPTQNLSAPASKDDPDPERFFSFGTARVTALKAIKEVLVVANFEGSVNAAAVGRDPVGVQVWEGTQWLLRDKDRRVRRAYVETLLTWLRLEMSKKDLRVVEDKRKLVKLPPNPNHETAGWDHLTRRAISNASRRDKMGKTAKSTYLQLLHLAVYDNAIESPDSEADLLLIHLLLANLVEKLGVNAVQHGLPMIMRLQEEINDDNITKSSTSKLNIGSLVYAYFWALNERFNLESTEIGFEIYREIDRRKSHGLWLDTIRVPPIQLDQIMSIPLPSLAVKSPPAAFKHESLQPFDLRPTMVDQITASYASLAASPPASPVASPGRVFSIPTFSSTKESSTSQSELPPSIKESMLSDWSREKCLMAVDSHSTRTVSLNSSRTNTDLLSRQKHLGVNGHSMKNDFPTRTHSPVQASPLNHDSNVDPQKMAPSSLQPGQQESYLHHNGTHNSGSPSAISSSDQNNFLRVDDLKRVLIDGATRGTSPLRHTTVRRDFGALAEQKPMDTEGESAISADGLNSSSETELPYSLRDVSNISRETHQPPEIMKDMSINRPRSASSRPQSSHVSDSGRPNTRSTLRPSSSSSSANEDPEANAKALRGDLVVPLPGAVGDSEKDGVPPVPPLPVGVTSKRNIAGPPGQAESKAVGESFISRKDGSISRGKKKKNVDVNALLGSIDTVAGGRGTELKILGGPPY